MSRGSLLVVVQRYGDVAGGAEAHARELVLRLREVYDIEVATTASRDFWTWANEFCPGETKIDGIAVRRFPVVQVRARDFRAHERRAYSDAHTLADERAFVEAQGPVTPDLLEHLWRRKDDFDHILFFTYIYYPTVYGLPLVPGRAVLVPTAHDEPALRLTIYKPVFHAPRAIAYNSDEERALVHRTFRNQRVPDEVVGVGVAPPAGASGERFRAAHGLRGPLFLYVGRVNPGKGCAELLANWAKWADRRPDGGATLVLVGRAEMPIPRRPDVLPLGVVSEAEKFDAYAACDAVFVPDHFVSLSMVALEAWASGRAIVCNTRCDVLRGMSRRSGGGVFYRSREEFAEICDLLVRDRDLARGLGAAGEAFVRSTYTWDRVVEKYLDLFAEVSVRNASLPGVIHAGP